MRLDTRLFATAVAALLVAVANAQPALSTASLSGRVLSEEGRTLRATVTLNLAAARGYPAPPRRVRTDANGNFAFSKLPAGKILCAQVAATEAAPANAPFIDTCDWGSSQPPVTLTRRAAVHRRCLYRAQGWMAQAPRQRPRPRCPTNREASGPTRAGAQTYPQRPDGLHRHARFIDHDKSPSR